MKKERNKNWKGIKEEVEYLVKTYDLEENFKMVNITQWKNIEEQIYKTFYLDNYKRIRPYIYKTKYKDVSDGRYCVEEEHLESMLNYLITDKEEQLYLGITDWWGRKMYYYEGRAKEIIKVCTWVSYDSFSIFNKKFKWLIEDDGDIEECVWVTSEEKVKLFHEFNQKWEAGDLK